MNSAQRKAYLEAMQIDTWRRRGSPAPTATPVPVPVTMPVSVSTPMPMPMPMPPQLAPNPAATADWAELERLVAGCRRCALCETRRHTVFGVGDRRARWFVVGEAPGADEDRQGEPFVGRAGQLLNAMLRAIGLERDQVFIANVLKCRPPNNRDPLANEAEACLPYLERQLALVEPRLVLVVGRIAAQNLLATDAPLARLRGRVHRRGDAGPPIVVTYHPAYLLRTPADKRKAWEDLKFAREVAERG